MTRYALCYQLNDGDVLPVPFAPDGFSKLQGRDYLRQLRIECKRRGYEVRADMTGNFTAHRAGQVAAVFMQEVSQADFEQSA